MTVLFINELCLAEFALAEDFLLAGGKSSPCGIRVCCVHCKLCGILCAIKCADTVYQGLHTFARVSTSMLAL